MPSDGHSDPEGYRVLPTTDVWAFPSSACPWTCTSLYDTASVPCAPLGLSPSAALLLTEPCLNTDDADNTYQPEVPEVRFVSTIGGEQPEELDGQQKLTKEGLDIDAADEGHQLEVQKGHFESADDGDQPVEMDGRRSKRSEAPVHVTEMEAGDKRLPGKKENKTAEAKHATKGDKKLEVTVHEALVDGTEKKEAERQDEGGKRLLEGKENKLARAQPSRHRDNINVITCLADVVSVCGHLPPLPLQHLRSIFDSIQRPEDLGGLIDYLLGHLFDGCSPFLLRMGIQGTTCQVSYNPRTGMSPITCSDMLAPADEIFDELD